MKVPAKIIAPVVSTARLPLPVLRVLPTALLAALLQFVPNAWLALS